MLRDRIVTSLRELAASLGPLTAGTEWHLFGSVDRNEPSAADIDLMILCISDAQADALRKAIDVDSLVLPIHLSLMTFAEASAVDAASTQDSTTIIPELAIGPALGAPSADTSQETYVFR